LPNLVKYSSCATDISLCLLLAKEARLREAVENLRTILEKFPDGTGESGIPLQPLARLKLLELQTNRFASDLVSINSFCSNIVINANPLTPALLGEALRMTLLSGKSALQNWQRIW